MEKLVEAWWDTDQATTKKSDRQKELKGALQSDRHCFLECTSAL